MNTIHEALLKVKNQKTLADICGVSQVAVSKWSTGKATPSASSILKILETLGIDLRWMHPEVFRDICIPVSSTPSSIVPEPPPTKPPETSRVDQDRRGMVRRKEDKGRRVNPPRRGKK
jgi:transcriptional regulator with XRE-family HTH domain